MLHLLPIPVGNVFQMDYSCSLDVRFTEVQSIYRKKIARSLTLWSCTLTLAGAGARRCIVRMSRSESRGPYSHHVAS